MKNKNREQLEDNSAKDPPQLAASIPQLAPDNYEKKKHEFIMTNLAKYNSVKYGFAGSSYSCFTPKPCSKPTSTMPETINEKSSEQSDDDEEYDEEKSTTEQEDNLRINIRRSCPIIPYKKQESATPTARSCYRLQEQSKDGRVEQIESTINWQNPYINSPKNDLSKSMCSQQQEAKSAQNC